MALTYKQRVARLDRMIASDNLLRGKWSDGKDRACLLAALSPEVQNTYIAASCPASVMPKWLAELTPWIDDSGTLEQWTHNVKRYAELAHKWSILSKEDWRRLDFKVRASSIRFALAKILREDKEIKISCQSIIDLCDRACTGAIVSADEWTGAAATAWAAAGAAAGAATEAARAAAEAAGTAPWAAAAAAAAAEAAGTAAEEDRLIAIILDDIDSAINAKFAHSTPKQVKSMPYEEIMPVLREMSAKTQKQQAREIECVKETVTRATK